jgi:alpha-beta hydrolase superfamily lysophospholipase
MSPAAVAALRAVDGVELALTRWPATASRRGTVQLVHGLGEHAGRHAPLAAALTTDGWDVAAHDLRGHGRSGGRRGAIPDGHALLADVAVVLDTVRVPGPHVLLGHSLGGLISARFVAEALSSAPAPWSRSVDGLVLSSPALGASLSRLQRLQLAVGNALAPDFAVGNGLDPAWMSRDPAVVADYRADPLVHDRVTARLGRFVLDSMAVVAERAPRWRTPTLLLWAGADRCVLPAGSEEFAAAAPDDVVDAQVFPGFAHEIFNEPGREAVLARVVDWLAFRV